MHCWLLTWIHRICSWCCSIGAYLCLQASRIPFSRRRICMGWLCLHSYSTYDPCPLSTSLLPPRKQPFWPYSISTLSTIGTLHGGFEGKVPVFTWPPCQHYIQWRSQGSLLVDHHSNHPPQPHHQRWGLCIRCSICTATYKSRRKRRLWRPCTSLWQRFDRGRRIEKAEIDSWAISILSRVDITWI